MVSVKEENGIDTEIYVNVIEGQIRLIWELEYIPKEDRGKEITVEAYNISFRVINGFVPDSMNL
jgi:hypothetical protein